MKFTKILPSDDKVLTDKETGTKLSYRDLTSIASKVNTASNLINFGEEILNKHKDTGVLLFQYVCDKGKGYAAYKIESDKINVKDIYSDTINGREDDICFEAITDILFNMSKSLNLPLLVKSDDDKFKSFINNVNQKYKDQKIEDKYWWTTE